MSRPVPSSVARRLLTVMWAGGWFVGPHCWILHLLEDVLRLYQDRSAGA